MKNKPLTALREVSKNLDINYSQAKKIYNEEIGDQKTSKALQNFKTRSNKVWKANPKKSRKSGVKEDFEEGDNLIDQDIPKQVTEN